MKSFLLIFSSVFAFLFLQSQDITSVAQCALDRGMRQSQLSFNDPYTVDENTVLLLHFDNNLDEEAHNYTVGDQGTPKTMKNGNNIVLP